MYQSRTRSKRDQDTKLTDIEMKVASYDQRLQEEVARQVDIRQSERSQQTQPSVPPVMVSPSGYQSSCASTGQVGDQTNEATAGTSLDEPRCLVDEITQQTSCELHIPFKNLTIKVCS